MNGKLPRVTSYKVIKVLEHIGFVQIRQSGVIKYIKTKMVFVLQFPITLDLHPKLLKNILKDADLSVDQFKKLL